MTQYLLKNGRPRKWEYRYLGESLHLQLWTPRRCQCKFLQVWDNRIPRKFRLLGLSQVLNVCSTHNTLKGKELYETVVTQNKITNKPEQYR